MTKTHHFPTPAVKGRFAPSPSGRMHLGNVATALISWLSAKSRGGCWLLRIEDLDPQRSKPQWARLIEDDLRWLGLDWDEGGIDGVGPAGPYLQSLRTDIYGDYLQSLRDLGLTYRCRCTRADIMATQAPHLSDAGIRYSGRCRPSPAPPFPYPDSQGSERLFVPDGEICFTDIVHGRCCFDPAKQTGDFILRRADGAWAYQLAVVIDDILMGVTEVVRGVDLLHSTAQQIYLASLLGHSYPSTAHIPLICNNRGQRLSKRDGAMSMEVLRRRFTPEQLIGSLAAVMGLQPTPQPLAARDLLASFDISTPKLKEKTLPVLQI